ncbi:divalent-cation tolerance protein CutA [Nitratireductor basaltis]|uniref:CutA1 divalent ion tolerance protein n=1 Tax=Nitratireductor basaltis TaxID=472175 RepID=A0A084U685_9HYPH|nr:divalent-cation tolerance protein CutA [Nitratireductor basaltis]KFB08471.1 CutA1 divalent ion tolerance protein [Nitratireductor basaltis]
MTGFIDIWVTCPDRDVAGKIAKATLSERIVACANIFGTVSSIYHWKGAIESEEEVPLLLKTRAEHFEAVRKLVREHHTYDVPAIVATPITEIDTDYADWLRDETKDPA